MNNLIVNPKENQCYKSISEAIAAATNLPSTGEIIIQIAPGIYHEKIELKRDNVTLSGLGSSPADTVITYDDFAYDIMPDGSKRGTFRSYTFLALGNQLTFENLTIENASGDSKTHGQAIALYIEGDEILVKNCRLLGHQDTLFTGPLPKKEAQPGGFVGPTEFADRTVGTHYFEDCYICGDVDFIFGSARAYFSNCEIESLSREVGFDPSDPDGSNSPMGFVTAASTYQEEEVGYVFTRCNFTAKDLPKESVYLGRPWRDYAYAEFMDCSFGPHINHNLFHEWNGRIAAGTTRYFASGCNFSE